MFRAGYVDFCEKSCYALLQKSYIFFRPKKRDKLLKTKENKKTQKKCYTCYAFPMGFSKKSIFMTSKLSRYAQLRVRFLKSNRREWNRHFVEIADRIILSWYRPAFDH